MDIRKKFRLNIFLNVLAALGITVLCIVLGMIEIRYKIKCTYFILALIADIMLINKAMLQVEHLDQISYNQGLKTFRNTLKNEN